MSYQPDFPPPPSQHKRGRRKPQKPPKQQRRRTPAPRPATPPGTQPPAYPPAGYPPGYGPEYGSGYGLPPGQPGARQHPVRRRGRRGCSIGPGCIFGCIGFVGVIMLGLLIAGILVYDYYSGELEDEIDKLAEIANYDTFETTVILDRDGNELFEVFDEGRRTIIDLDQIPQHMIDATISIEDDTFYENRGIDIPSIARAGWQYVRYGYVVSGGSTITQQLIRNVLFTEEYKYEQSLNRKLDEALLAVVLTQRMSKDEIMELYLNEIPYGNLAYGIEAAAQTYFGKPAAELTLAESALLAGLPQAPAGLDPLNPDPTVQQRVASRRRLVLDLMVKNDFITRDEADAAYAEPLNFVSPDIRLDAAPHMVFYAQDELESLLMDRLNRPQDEIRKMIAGGGLRVYTSVDMDFQRIAEDVARQQVAQLQAVHNMNNAAVIVLRPETGEILAMVGSVDFENELIDGQVNVTIAQRQPGSAMKPFTYAAAMEHGWNAATVIWDTQTRIPIAGQQDYEPGNYDNAYHGPVRVREALANSYNIPAVQTLRQIGVDYLLWMMHRVGVQSLSDDASNYGLSLTLGGGEVTPLELTTAYAVLANGGRYVAPTSILCVTNSSGDILYEYQGYCPSGQLTATSVSVLADPRPVMDERIAFVISNILADNNARTPAMGANSPLYTPGLPTSVKTGTTNDFRDNWTVGYTRNIAVGVWAGNTDNTPMNHVSGLDGAAPIWNGVITRIYQTPGLMDSLGGRPPDDAHLYAPANISQRQLCNISRTALRDPATSCSQSTTEWLFDGPVMVPDSQGNLVPGQQPQQAPQSANGPQPVEVEPGLIRVQVVPVAPELANAIAAADPSGQTSPPRYCQVPIEIVNSIPGVQEQLFIAPPPVAEDAFRARVWAQANGVAILPQYACNEQMLQMAAGGGGGAPVVVANITSPTQNQVFSTADQIDIIGSAIFTSQQAAFYKIEIQGGQWGSFTTMHDISIPPYTTGMTNGVLHTIGPYALPPGQYVIQLVVVGLDMNWLQQPFQVFFQVQ